MRAEEIVAGLRGEVSLEKGMLTRKYFVLTLSCQHGTAIDIEDFAADEACVFGAEEQDRSSDFFGSRGAAQGNGILNLLLRPRILQSGN